MGCSARVWAAVHGRCKVKGSYGEDSRISSKVAGGYGNLGAETNNAAKGAARIDSQEEVD